MMLILSMALLSAGLVVLGILEFWFHIRGLKRIPIRIHVAGTRGKSSVARLIAAGLNEAGITTVAKTTGTLSRMILPDGLEVPVYRPAGPNIIEQKRIIKAANSLGTQAIVMECMALQPILHWVLEDKIIRATHSVITNARADHLDIMGPTEVEVAQTLAGMIPKNGMLFTAEQRHREVFEAACKDRNTKFKPTEEEEIENITDEDLSDFSYSEHKENVALALNVLEEFGIERSAAMRGMWKTRPDPGALTEYRLDFFGRNIVFVNGFAANDPESTETIWNYALEKYGDVEQKIGVFNLRGDRPSRTQQLAKETSFWHSADKVILMGTGAYLFAKIAAKSGVDPYSLIIADSSRTEDLFETIVGHCGVTTLIVGMGNIGGLGLSLVRFFKNRSCFEVAS